MADIADKIKNKSLTVREAVKNAGVTLATDKGMPTALAKNIEAAGLSLDAPWDDVKNNQFLIKLNEVGTEANFTTLTTVENRLKEVANVGDIPYPYTTVFGAGSKSRTIKVDGKPLEKAAQARRKAKPIGIPEAKRAIPAFVQGINVIPDDQVRAAVAFNMLVPLRPIEVSNIGIDDIDFETGKFKEAWRRGNKIRNDIELPEVALELLRDARDAAIANKQDKIFDVNTEKLTKATKLPGGIADQFKKFESIMGRSFKGSSDIRKIVPSLMVGELQAGIEVSTIMGHASTDEMMGSIKKMTASSYISPIITSEGSAAKQALRGYHNMIAEVLELGSLNELPPTIGFSANALTAKDAPKFAVIPRNSDIAPTPEKQTMGTISDSDLGLFEDIKAERRAQLQLSTAQATKEALLIQKDLPPLDEAAIRAKEERRLLEQTVKKEVRSKITAEAATDPLSTIPEEDVAKLKKLGLWERFGGKLTVGAVAGLGAYQFLTEPAQAAADVAMEVGARAVGFGAGPAAAVPMIMAPTELGSGELQAGDRPATQEELMSQVRQRAVEEAAVRDRDFRAEAAMQQGDSFLTMQP